MTGVTTTGAASLAVLALLLGGPASATEAVTTPGGNGGIVFTLEVAAGNADRLQVLDPETGVLRELTHGKGTEAVVRRLVALGTPGRLRGGHARTGRRSSWSGSTGRICGPCGRG